MPILMSAAAESVVSVVLVSELVSVVVLLVSELELPQAARLNAMVSARSVARNFFILNFLLQN
jgi:hypothetical protein